MIASDRTALQFENVAKTFQARGRSVAALSDLSIAAGFGTITGLIGPDGAGKTTLLRLAVGLLEADSGTIRVLGLDVARHALQVQSRVGYMPQRFGLYEDLSVQENLSLYADLQGVPVDARAERYEELMRMTGLAPFLTRLAGKLSGGMKQKLGLACTLIHPPQLLLLDEPTVGVDPVSRRELWAIVKRFVEEEGTTVLISTAYLDEAERCDDVIMLDRGHVIGQGPPQSFSESLSGRTLRARVATLKNRDVLEMLSGRDEVTDAVIHEGAVRVVLQPGRQLDLRQILSTTVSEPISSDDVELREVAPRFEDAFIAALHERRGDRNPTQGSIEAGSAAAAKQRNPETPVISVRDVARRFGDFYAVRKMSFDVTRGEIFGLLGANGAGKTTMFRMLCGLLPASAGTLQVAGINVRKTAAAARARIGYMSQKFSLYATLSVHDNLRFFSSAYGLAGQRRDKRIEWATAEFDLESVLDDTSGELPLGFKQRLALACALMHEPEILFLDEPTSGVDPVARREFWRRINALSAQDVTVLVTTHFMEEAEYCDRMAIMVSGELLALGSPTEIKRQAQTDSDTTPTMEEAFITLISSESEHAEERD